MPQGVRLAVPAATLTLLDHGERPHPNGRERSRTFDTLADATTFEAKVRTLKRAGSLAELDAGTETLAEFAAEWWELYAGPNLERSTLKGYATLWNAHLLPHLGELRLREIDVRTVMRLRAGLEAAGVGRQAIRKSLAVLQSILQRAVEWQRIPSNPVRAVRKPAPKRVRAVEPIAPPRIEAMRTRLVAAGRLRDATLVSVLAYAGLRPQEALALEWRHVRERTLLIEQALSDGELKGPPRAYRRPAGGTSGSAESLRFRPRGSRGERRERRSTPRRLPGVFGGRRDDRAGRREARLSGSHASRSSRSRDRSLRPRQESEVWSPTC